MSTIDLTGVKAVVPLREALAADDHDQWAHWTRHFLAILEPLLSEVYVERCMPNGHFAAVDAAIARWRRQIDTPYHDLTEKEKDSDRKWADKTLALLRGDGPVALEEGPVLGPVKAIVDWRKITEALKRLRLDKDTRQDAVKGIAAAIEGRVFHNRALDSFLSSDDVDPHDDPTDCPTYYDGCNCTVKCLVDIMEDAEQTRQKLSEAVEQRDTAKELFDASQAGQQVLRQELAALKLQPPAAVGLDPAWVCIAGEYRRLVTSSDGHKATVAVRWGLYNERGSRKWCVNTYNAAIPPKTPNPLEHHDTFVDAVAEALDWAHTYLGWKPPKEQG